ncbi:hypothetical protein [Prauserella muralis]|uniref:Uncharacterized protein n=1 Tax=Prauserella muralis TaxID=588067 RepID=A0A2V4ACF7_9PSEU|nr:hypothetical protein [Prauserella muralis]PXY16575.1 hypothetical protein BAY60_35855 [Prauserella muralis]TWE11185.1 hypothetical protein FHX69_7404 [Prauserella muralis]
MTHQLDTLAWPQVSQMSVEERLWRADECRTLVTALREQAGVLHAGAPAQAPLAIQQLNEFAERLLRRAARLDIPTRRGAATPRGLPC